MNSLKEIVIHYPFIAKYRVPIFDLLSKSYKYTFHFWTDNQCNDKFLVTDSGSIQINKTPLNMIKIPIVGKSFEWQPDAIKRILKESIDVYIVLGNPNSLSTWICVLIAKIRQIPILMWSHGYLKDEKGLKNIVRKLFYSLASGHLLYGNRAKEIMISKGFDVKNLHVIYNSLDYDMQKYYREMLEYPDRLSIRKYLQITENSIVLIAIGRLMKKLKLDQAIQAIKIANESRDVTLLIVGDGPEKNNLDSLCISLNVDKKVIFYGACHDEVELSKLYNASDYSVVMGKVGLAAMHSLAYGIPMITNNNIEEHFPEIEAIKNGVTGCFFEEDSIDDFITKIKPIDYRSTMYQNCINEIEKNYTPQRQQMFIEDAIANYIDKK